MGKPSEPYRKTYWPTSKQRQLKTFKDFQRPSRWFQADPDWWSVVLVSKNTRAQQNRTTIA